MDNRSLNYENFLKGNSKALKDDYTHTIPVDLIMS